MLVNRDIEPHDKTFRIVKGKMNLPRHFHEEYFFRPKKFINSEVQAIGHSIQITIWSRKQCVQIIIPTKRWHSDGPRKRSISDMTISLSRWVHHIEGAPDGRDEALSASFEVTATVSGFDGRQWVPPQYVTDEVNSESTDDLSFYNKKERERGKQLTYSEAEFLIYRYIRDCHLTKSTVKSREVLKKYGYNETSKHNLTRVGDKLEELLELDEVASSKRDKRYRISEDIKRRLNCIDE